jgi:hypothetical protein
MATKQKRKIKERDINLLMRNALVWFWDTNKQKWVFS